MSGENHESHEEKREEQHHEHKSGGTITIKKDDLWKYSTMILAVVVIVGGLLMFSGGDSSTGGAVANAGGATVADLEPFLLNPQIYPSLGPEDSKNVVIEFSDFQCPFCAMAEGSAEWVAQYQSQYGSLIGVAGTVQEMAANGELKFIYVPWSFLGQESVYAAEAALCANEQDKFWEMHDAIFEAHDGEENNGKYNKDKLQVLAAGISGINKAEFNSCLENDDYLSALQQISSDVQGAGVTGTPTFFVNGQKVSASTSAILSALK